MPTSSTGMASAAGPVSIRVSPRLKLAACDLVEEIAALGAIERFAEYRGTAGDVADGHHRRATRVHGRDRGFLERELVGQAVRPLPIRVRVRNAPDNNWCQAKAFRLRASVGEGPNGSNRLIARSSTCRASSGRPTDRYGADNQSSHSLNAVSSPDSASNVCSSSPAAIASRSCSTRSQVRARASSRRLRSSTGMSSA